MVLSLDFNEAFNHVSRLLLIKEARKRLIFQMKSEKMLNKLYACEAFSAGQLHNFIDSLKYIFKCSKSLQACLFKLSDTSAQLQNPLQALSAD